MSTPALAITIAGYSSQVTRNPDGGLTVVVDIGFLGQQAVVITGEEWRALLAFQPGVVEKP